ncbi:NDR1/HIN1-like protein 13 [Chenopodium quinoa]|uniref:NDR1/HIN1-like protein 13 n=1 Tax=Chenopodium quinoa TaxID=63459 RepID=UPI000B76D61C|nr:NDR1/HIN1-like protein 13 [Chenopodium quinoa]
MEERVPDHDHDHDHDHNRSSTNNEDQDEEFDDFYNIYHEKNNVTENEDEEMQIVPSTKHEDSTPQPHSTYIIQVPKDQIYRVPPPENAGIVEKYRNPVQNNQSGHRRRCAYWCLSIFLVVAFIVSVIVCVNHFTLSPKNPDFSIKRVVIKNPPPSSKKNASPKIQVSLEATNPNSVNDIGYGQGNATLMYKGKAIGHGSYPALVNQESGKSDEVDVVLAVSSKGGLPKELVSQSHNSNNNRKKALVLNLLLNIPLKLKTWLFTKKIDVKVGCKFEVNSVGEKIRVLSQKCDIQK